MQSALEFFWEMGIFIQRILFFYGIFAIQAENENENNFNLDTSIMHSCDYMPINFKLPTKRLVIAPRIVGGQPAYPSEFPYQVALLIYVKPSSIELCGGSLISQNYILTAAHCVADAIAARILLGTNSLVNASQVAQQVFVNSSAFIVHPNWEPEIAKNDIALIELPEPVEYSEKIQPINLPSYKLAEEDFENLTAIASGWGHFSDDVDTPSLILRYATMTIISQEECEYFFSSILMPTNICTDGAEGRATCGGDSGGPLILQDEGINATIIGITSFGLRFGCELGFPSVFTRVSSYLDWISMETGITIRD